MPNQAQQNGEPAEVFAHHLKHWRKLRRQSQLELSLAAGISQRHVSFLESGRASPSRNMVLTLAETLDVPLRERNTWLGAAGFAAVYPERSLDDAALAAALQALTVMLEHHEPWPACVVDRNWNLLLGNDALTRIFGLFVDPLAVWSAIGSPSDAPNIARLTLHPEGLAPHIVNFDDMARWFLDRLARGLAHDPTDGVARALLAEFSALPGLPPDATEPGRDSATLDMHLQKDGLDLKLFSVVSTFGTPLDVTLSELRVEAFFPADDATRKIIDRLT